MHDATGQQKLNPKHCLSIRMPKQVLQVDMSMTSERESAGMHALFKCGALSSSVQQSTAADAVQQRRKAVHDRQAHTLR